MRMVWLAGWTLEPGRVGALRLLCPGAGPAGAGCVSYGACPRPHAGSTLAGLRGGRGRCMPSSKVLVPVRRCHLGGPSPESMRVVTG